MFKKAVAIFIFLLATSFFFSNLSLAQEKGAYAAQDPNAGTPGWVDQVDQITPVAPVINAPQTGDYPFEYGLRPDRLGAPNITKCNSLPNCLFWFFTLVFRTMIWLAGAFAVIMIILAGLLYMTKPEDAKNIHSRLYWAALGLIVALSSFGLVKFIEFNLSRVTLINGENYADQRGSYWLEIFVSKTFAQADPLGFEPPEQLGGVPGCDAVSIFKFLPGGGRNANTISGDLWKNCILSFLANKILPLIYTVSLLVSVGVILWAGLEYVQSSGNVTNVHQRLTWAIVGIIITVVAFTLVKAIELSLSIPSPGPRVNP